MSARCEHEIDGLLSWMEGKDAISTLVGGHVT